MKTWFDDLSEEQRERARAEFRARLEREVPRACADCRGVCECVLSDGAAATRRPS